MKQKTTRYYEPLRQAVIAVLLFMFLGQLAWAGIAEDIADSKPLQEVVQAGIDDGMELKDLVFDLNAAGVDGSDIVCALFQVGQDHSEVIAAALDGGLSNADVAGWAEACGATQSEIQTGYSMSGENLPAHKVFSDAEQYERNSQEYLYNTPSQSK